MRCCGPRSRHRLLLSISLKPKLQLNPTLALCVSLASFLIHFAPFKSLSSSFIHDHNWHLLPVWPSFLSVVFVHSWCFTVCPCIFYESHHLSLSLGQLSLQKQASEREVEALKAKLKWTEGQLRESEKREAQTQAKLTVRQTDRHVNVWVHL